MKHKNLYLSLAALFLIFVGGATFGRSTSGNPIGLFIMAPGAMILGVMSQRLDRAGL